jgi:hypothetical protein
VNYLIEHTYETYLRSLENTFNLIQDVNEKLQEFINGIRDYARISMKRLSNENLTEEEKVIFDKYDPLLNSSRYNKEAVQTSSIIESKMTQHAGDSSGAGVIIGFGVIAIILLIVLGLAASSSSVNIPSNFMDVQYTKALAEKLPHSQQIKILNEMSLVYFYALFDGYTKDILVELFAQAPSIMEGDTELKYREILNHRSIQDLHETMAEKLVDKNMRNIDEIVDFMVKKCRIDVGKKFPGWGLLKSYYYRRNLIVHNRSLVNDTYIEKTNDTNVKKGEMISISFQDIQACFEVMKGYFHFMKEEIAKIIESTLRKIR